MKARSLFVAAVLLFGVARPANAAVTLTTELVTHIAGNQTAASDGQTPELVMSDDGRYSAFTSLATNLVSPFIDNNTAGKTDVYLFDRNGSLVQLVSDSILSGGNTGNGQSAHPSMSADGRFIVFDGTATDLMAPFIDGNTSFGRDVFLFDREFNQTILVSHKDGANNTGGNGTSTFPRISADGTTIVYESTATDLIPSFTDTNLTSLEDIWSYDVFSGVTTLVSHADSGPTIGAETAPSTQWTNSDPISGNGRKIVLMTDSDNLTPGFVDHNGTESDLFVYDGATGDIALVTEGAANEGGTGGPFSFDISTNGARIAYDSTATDLIDGFVNNNGVEADVFTYDIKKDKTSLVSHATTGKKEGGDGPSQSPQIDAKGKAIAYLSDADDLVTAFTDNNAVASDVFSSKIAKLKNTLVSRSTAGGNAGANGAAGAPLLSDTGGRIAFSSGATDMIAGFADGNGGNNDAFVYDPKKGTKKATIRLVSHKPGLPLASGNAGSGLLGLTHTTSKDATEIVFTSAATDLLSPFTAGTGLQLFLSSR